MEKVVKTEIVEEKAETRVANAYVEIDAVCPNKVFV